jgi:mRNA interferase MazF
VRAIHIARLDKARPVVVLTRAIVHPHINQLTVAPITTRVRGLSTEVAVGEANGLESASVIACDSIVTIPKDDLGSQIGWLYPAEEGLLTAAIHAAFDLR